MAIMERVKEKRRRAKIETERANRQEQSSRAPDNANDNDDKPQAG
ncbi:hypothetical protein BOSEA31B_10206 [Hyphomicrobiales bacterium]|nr:hypothetical protein BOSEA31B_10206 [Hyphomicrobiales bacterium]CAH1701885.1 hypothetical protein BOSEA1005_21584 [Hyphomicrobiales bacterium]CAI0346042.1 hypothetical protein BO1005MUT1_470200 [Hyphomicrobiales bacterium]